MPADDPFAGLMGRLRARDKDADADVFRSFTQRLVAPASACFDRRVRS
jgi:hypothetical protein